MSRMSTVSRMSAKGERGRKSIANASSPAIPSLFGLSLAVADGLRMGWAWPGEGGETLVEATPRLEQPCHEPRKRACGWLVPTAS